MYSHVTSSSYLNTKACKSMSFHKIHSDCGMDEVSFFVHSFMLQFTSSHFDISVCFLWLWKELIYCPSVINTICLKKGFKSKFSQILRCIHLHICCHATEPCSIICSSEELHQCFFLMVCVGADDISFPSQNSQSQPRWETPKNMSMSRVQVIDVRDTFAHECMKKLDLLGGLLKMLHVLACQSSSDVVLMDSSEWSVCFTIKWISPPLQC